MVELNYEKRMTPSLYFLGPLVFNYTGYEGGLPSTYYYPYSWTRVGTSSFLVLLIVYCFKSI